jgi:hypothetical protein
MNSRAPSSVYTASMHLWITHYTADSDKSTRSRSHDAEFRKMP